MNVDINHHAVPKPMPNQTNRLPEGATGKPGIAEHIGAGKLEGALTLEQPLESVIEALPEPGKEIAPPKPQDAFTQSEALVEKNELIQIWKDSQNGGAQTNSPGMQVDEGFLVTRPGVQQQSGVQQPALSPNIDWGNLSNEILNFLQNMNPGNVGEGLDYLISRFVALEKQLGAAPSTGAHKQPLEQTFTKGRRQLIDGYVGKLKQNLHLSDADATRLKHNMETMFDKRLQSYQKLAAQTGSDAGKMNQDNHYMAARLRSSMTQAGAQDQSLSFQALRGKEFSFGDMRHAGEFSNGYQMLYQNAGMGTERDLAADMAMVDMKMKALIDKGLVGKRMANMLQNTAVQRHEQVMNAADARIAARSRNDMAMMETAAAKPVNRGLVKELYEAILTVFHRNGGNLMEAIREGLASFGKSGGYYRTRGDEKDGTIYEIDGRGYIGANRPIVRVAQVGRIRDIALAFGVVGSLVALWYFIL